MGRATRLTSVSHSGNRSSDVQYGPNPFSLGARAASALEALGSRGQNPEYTFTPSLELIDCMDALLGVRFDVPVELDSDSTARARAVPSLSLSLL